MTEYFYWAFVNRVCRVGTAMGDLELRTVDFCLKQKHVKAKIQQIFIYNILSTMKNSQEQKHYELIWKPKFSNIIADPINPAIFNQFYNTTKSNNSIN